jgi:oxygen-independent coproporphyrinogen-3 oxidase
MPDLRPASLPDARSAYIHVPFCAHRCGYCDFTLVAGRDDLVDRYLDAMELELPRLGRPREVDTLFFGGGTPTHLSASQLHRLFELVGRWLRPAAGCEISVEANPAGLDDAKIDVLSAAGVNRVSLGAQSFDAGVLELLERDHRRAEIISAVERLRPRIGNIGLDLIFGVPGQSAGLWRQTLDEALSLHPAHLSTYGLTFEKGTSFYSRLSRGALSRCDEELEQQMYADAIDVLAAAGFEHYEISNFARPGRRCRHNEVYWTGGAFYGFGPGAASYLDGTRELNHRSVTTWLKRVFAGDSPIAEREHLDPESRARELIMLGLRRCEGIDLKEFRRQTGFELETLGGEALVRQRRDGLVQQVDGRVSLTREGRFVTDTVVATLL